MPYYGEPPFWQSSWEYEFADSWVTATSVWGPFESGNAVYMGSGIGKYLKDFEVSAKVKWEDGQYNSVGFSVGGGYYWGDVSLRYAAKYPADPVIRLSLHNWGGTSEVFMPAPPPGEHVLKLTREGTLVSAYVDDILFHSEHITDYREINGAALIFGGPKEQGSPMFKPVSVDWINVVPEPATVVLLGGFSGLLLLKRRRQPRQT